MNAVTPFDFEGRAVRVVEDAAGMPWFVALDVCECLGIRNSRDAVGRLDEDERSDVGITDTSSNGTVQARSVLAVNEPGLYSLTLTSRKPEAKRFKRWITHDVLPALRRTGTYTVPSADAPPPLASQPQHRADQLVGASRIFAAAFRTARIARLPYPQAMQAATDCAKRHTGIDWQDECNLPIPEPEQSTHRLDDPLREKVEAALYHRTNFQMEPFIAEHALGEPGDTGLMKRIATIAHTVGFRPWRGRNHARRFITEWRRIVP